MGTRQSNISLAVIGLVTIGIFMTPPARSSTLEEQLKSVQDQVSLLEQQIKLANLQQTQTSAMQSAMFTALKTQVLAQSELEKSSAQADFAKLAGVKAGLDSVGAPLGKDGTITVTTGTAGAAMLSLRTPMLAGLETSASFIVNAVKGKGNSIYIGSDVQVQSAIQSEATKKAILQAISALESSIKETALPTGAPAHTAAVTEAAAAGLILNTLVGLEKFFRVDTSYTVYDNGDDAQQALMLMLQYKLTKQNIDYVNLSDISIADVMARAEEAQGALTGLSILRNEASFSAASIDKIKADDKSRPTQDKIDLLKSNISLADALVDALHPAKNPEKFWIYVQGLTFNTRMLSPNSPLTYRDRLVVVAKSQTIQIVEKRTWRSDKIFGKSDIQIEHRLINSSGKLLDGSLRLLAFKGDKDKANSVLFDFPKPRIDADGEKK